MNTEDEAKQKWCPMSRVIVGSPGEGLSESGNRFEDCQGSIAYQQTRCLGSDCNMWRWLDDGKVRTCEDPNCDSWTKKSRMGNDFTTTYYWEKDDINRKGYCGLAGKPEVSQ